MLVHRGFLGQIDFDSKSEKILGEVINAPDVIIFQGCSAIDIREAFIQAVDEYIKFYSQQSHDKVIPIAGHFTVRLRPEQHQLVVDAAKQASKSVNNWIAEALEDATGVKKSA